MARRRREDDDYEDEEELDDRRYDDEDEDEDEEYERRRRKKQRKKSDAIGRLAGPAIALLVMGILGELYALFNLFVVVFEPFGPIGNPFRLGNPGGPPQPGERAGQLVGAFLPPISIFIVLVGAWQMKNAKNYGLAMTAAIIACLPCCTPCIILGIPFGIWAVIVLSNRDVSSVFT